jgi:hypothetical protein
MRRRSDSRSDRASARSGAGLASRTICRLLAATCITVGLIAPKESPAHHGPAAYDRSQTVTVTGSVTRFDFVNPHVLIYVAVEEDDGEKVIWSGELTSPNRLARMGGSVAWHKDLLQPGDVITLTGSPARNGARVMQLTRVVDDEGTVLTASGR